MRANSWRGHLGALGLLAALGGGCGRVDRAGPPDPGGLSEAQVLGVLQSLDQGELQQAQLLQVNARSELTRDYAAIVANDQQKALGRQSGLGLTAASSDTSQRLDSRTRAELASLASLPPEGLDQTYLSRQITDLEAERQLLANLAAQAGARLAQEVAAAQASANEHLRLAVRVQSQLNRNSGIGTSGAIPPGGTGGGSSGATGGSSSSGSSGASG